MRPTPDAIADVRADFRSQYPGLKARIAFTIVKLGWKAATRLQKVSVRG